MTQLFDDAGKRALVDAIKRIEARSSAEIVIAVRKSAEEYRAVDLAIGVAVGLGALAFMLFSRYPFGTVALFVDPLLAGVTAALLSIYAPWIKHFFLGRARRREAVRRAALVAFHDQGAHRTRGRTGVLVFLSLLEGMAELVYDVGVEIHVEPEEHEALRAALEHALPEKGVAVAAALEKLGDLLAPRIPRAEDDVNELPDEVG